MYPHAPRLLPLPVTRARPWWKNVEGSKTAPMHRPSEPVTSSDSPIREDLVARIREEIADGTYDTPEKWEIALSRLLERLHRE